MAVPPKRLDEARRKRTNETRETRGPYRVEQPKPIKHQPELAQNVELEERLLAALLDDSQLLPAVRDAFRFPEDLHVSPFYTDGHQQLYKRMLEIYDSGRIPEYYTLLDMWITSENAGLDAKDERGLVDRLIHITMAQATPPSERKVLQWAQLLRGQALRRAAEGIRMAAAGIAYPSDPALAAADPDEELRKLSILITQLANSTAPLVSRLPIISDEEAEAMKPAQGILGDVLYEDSIAFLYGPSGRWKSFVAVSWGMAIATGFDWLGRQVEEGDVLYIAGEGVRGLGKRISAWKRRHGISGKTRMHVLGMPIHLLDAEQVQELIGIVRARFPEIKMIIIDTLARALIGGDENSTADANMAFENASQIRAALGCCVLVIHHSGKDGLRGMRGSSVFFNNADTVIRIAGPEDKPLITPGETIKLVSEKPKENDPFADIHLTTEIERWANDDGAIESSLVIVASSTPAPKQSSGAQPFIPAGQQKLLDELTARPGGVRSMDWERATGQSHTTFQRNRDQLMQRDLVACDAGVYTLTDSGRMLSTSPYQISPTVLRYE